MAPPRRTTSEELTREMIMEKAREQFIEKGFSDVSMRSIATILGCSHGAIYYHFKNKADLFYSIVASDFAVLDKLQIEIVAGAGSLDEKLRTLFMEFLRFGLDNQKQYELMFMLRVNDVDSLSQRAASESYERFAKSVYELHDKKPAIRNIWSAFIALHGFVSHYHGYVSSFEEVAEAATNHVDFVIKGMEV